MSVTNDFGWRGVLVPPPNPLSAIGVCLRHAIRCDSSGLRRFSALLGRLGGR